jgi:hypothetical protein
VFALSRRRLVQEARAPVLSGVWLRCVAGSGAASLPGVPVERSVCGATWELRRRRRRPPPPRGRRRLGGQQLRRPAPRVWRLLRHVF